MVTSSHNALHQHLKLATAAAHSSLECILAKRGYFDGRDQYIHYLQRFLAFHEEAEQSLDTPITVEAVPDWQARRRAHLARVDLEILGAPAREFPRSSGRLPPVVSREAALGIVYMLEGSTLGSAYLLRQLAPLGITATHGGCYLASYGSDRGKMWQRFLFTLEESQLQPLKVDSIAAAAIATFTAARFYLADAEPAGVVRAARECSMVA